MASQINAAGRAKRKKAFVGMSGGVDSSVSAALLQEQGYDVTGVFIKVWQPDWMECSWREDHLDAMRVALRLGIPFVTIDLEAEYKKEVVDYMISEYRAGRTPNPDIMCNRHVKFGAFFDWAMGQAKKGADEEIFVATGHYAQTHVRAGHFELVAGVDQGKDQSYFLWALTERELSRTIFPVGGMEKSETRRLARKFGLPVAEKRDSQGLCFIGRVDIKEFLSRYIEPRRGAVLNAAGEAIGHHDGAIFLTIGERHGFVVTKKGASEEPYYVVSRDLDKNTVTVAHRASDGSLSMERNAFELERTNWIGKIPQIDREYAARIRHLGGLMPCTISVDGKNASISFKEKLYVAAGQSVVAYDGECCIGGGIVMI